MTDQEWKLRKRCNYYSWINGGCTNLEYYKVNYGGTVSEHIAKVNVNGKNVKLKEYPFYLIKKEGETTYGEKYYDFIIYTPKKDDYVLKDRVFQEDEGKMTNAQLWKYILDNSLIKEYLEFLRDKTYYFCY